MELIQVLCILYFVHVRQEICQDFYAPINQKLVFDVNANTVTVHRDNNTSITVPVTFSSSNVTSMATRLNGENTKQGFYRDITGGSGEAYINRITYMVGDIFA